MSLVAAHSTRKSLRSLTITTWIPSRRLGAKPGSAIELGICFALADTKHSGHQDRAVACRSTLALHSQDNRPWHRKRHSSNLRAPR